MTTVSTKNQRKRNEINIPGDILLGAFNSSQAYAKNIRTILEKENITSVALAGALGVTPWTIWAWLRNLYSPRSPIIIKTIEEWANRLNSTNAGGENGHNI